MGKRSKGKVPAFNKEEKFWRREHNTGVTNSQVLVAVFLAFFFHDLVSVKCTVYKHFYFPKMCGLVNHSDTCFYLLDAKIINLEVSFFNPYSKRSVQY